jgi:hypothetical protein
LWRGCPRKVAKHPHQISACKLMVLAMCCACSLPVCRCPVVSRRQMQTYNNVDTLRSETARDKPSHITCQCRTPHCTRS